jgi:hypothetical protein
VSRYTVARLSASHNSRTHAAPNNYVRVRELLSLEISMVECMSKTADEKYGLRRQIILQLTSGGP